MWTTATTATRRATAKRAGLLALGLLMFAPAAARVGVAQSAAPASGQTYLCWLETDGRNVPVGHMEFAGETAYWLASLDEWKTWEIGPTTTFVVTLEPSGAQQRTGSPSLEAQLAS